MTEKLAAQIRTIADIYISSPVSQRFVTRLEEDGKLTENENPFSHFCVIFAAYDPIAKQVFVGEHRKSGLWLFNGGHIQIDETVDQTSRRETREEWGLDMDWDKIGEPKLLTITEINNPVKQSCRRHYDIWYFVPVNKENFRPNQVLLANEFEQNAWLGTQTARTLITDPGTLEAIERFEDIFSN